MSRMWWGQGLKTVNVLKADKLQDLNVSNQMDAVIDRSSDINVLYIGFPLWSLWFVFLL